MIESLKPRGCKRLLVSGTCCTTTTFDRRARQRAAVRRRAWCPRISATMGRPPKRGDCPKLRNQHELLWGERHDVLRAKVVDKKKGQRRKKKASDLQIAKPVRTALTTFVIDNRSQHQCYTHLLRSRRFWRRFVDFISFEDRVADPIMSWNNVALAGKHYKRK